MTNKERFLSICEQQVHREGLPALMAWLEKSDFYEAPASTRYHGNHPGGLLEHSLNVFDELNRLRSAFPEVPMSDETAAIISLFHDLCKVNMYQQRNETARRRMGGGSSTMPTPSRRNSALAAMGANPCFWCKPF